MFLHTATSSSDNSKIGSVRLILASRSSPTIVDRFLLPFLRPFCLLGPFASVNGFKLFEFVINLILPKEHI